MRVTKADIERYRDEDASVEDALWAMLNEGNEDDGFGIEGSEPAGWWRIGQWVCAIDSQGFVDWHEYESVATAENVMRLARQTYGLEVD